MINTLEYKIHFLSEKRTETYKWYVEGASQMKSGFGAKSGLQDQAWLGLGRRGV
jgi:hypothetical protein